MDSNAYLNDTNNKTHISTLPTEVFSLILRYLDERSLINASHVNNSWYLICKKDPILRKKLKKQELKQKRLRWCRAKYGDGTMKSRNLFKLSREVLLKRKIRLARLKLIFTLRSLRDLWLGFRDSLTYM